MVGVGLLAIPLDGATATGVGLTAIASVGLATLLAAAETAVAAVRRARVQQLLEEGVGGARRLQRVMENSTGLVATSRLVIVAGIVGANTTLAAALAPVLATALGSTVWAYALLAGLVLLLAVVLVQQTGHGLGARYAEPIAVALAGPLLITVWLASPVVKLLDFVGGLVYRPSSPPGGAARDAGTSGTVTEAEIMLQVDVAEEEGVLEEDEGEMIRSIFEFGDTMAREIMIPRVDIKAAPEEATVAETVDLAISTGHSRIPIYRNTVDDVTGIFYVKDALRLLRDGRLDVRVREVVREPHFVPETKKVDDLLAEMQARHVHVAIVVDEYGGTAGLLTIEDILEEIVGEIQDEFDAEEAPLQRLSEREAVVDALMTLDDVNDALSIRLEADDVDTLGGYVYAKLGRVPQQGDEIAADGTRLIVEEVEGNRINKVRILKVAEPAPAATPDAPVAPPTPPSPAVSTAEAALERRDSLPHAEGGGLHPQRGEA